MNKYRGERQSKGASRTPLVLRTAPLGCILALLVLSCLDINRGPSMKTLEVRVQVFVGDPPIIRPGNPNLRLSATVPADLLGDYLKAIPAAFSNTSGSQIVVLIQRSRSPKLRLF